MITQKELIQKGWVYNNFTYRDNGEATLTTEVVDVRVDTRDEDTGEVDDDGNAIYKRIVVYEPRTIVTGQTIVKVQDKVEEYVKQFYVVDYWATIPSRQEDTGEKNEDGSAIYRESPTQLVPAKIKVTDMAFVAKLDVIRTTKTFFAFIIDTKDGFKVQIKTDLNLITPDVFSTEDLGEAKFDFNYEDLEVKFEELTSLKLEDY